MKFVSCKSAWSSFVIDGSTNLSLSSIQDEANLYDVFNSDIGRQFFNNNLCLFALGIHVIIPLLRVSISFFFFCFFFYYYY